MEKCFPFKLKRRGDFILVCGENDEKNRIGLLTSFWSNIWVGSVPLKVPFYMPFLISEHKDKSLRDVIRLVGGNLFWDFHQKRYFSVWEEDLLFNLHQIL